ncbi:hypothetical protein BGZ96_004018 [Linnemannia gamsii]|uniref:Uncharacterized protein n=1 Tax=Linnemannia gamsii TaxID=64522 RepID=A0ABQ7K6W5_9FUNG|nr:hypothetical protein BGZ96_004018 [Linnemannia gamsii]
MRTILSALVAITLAIAAHAAPASTIYAPPTITDIPSANTRGSNNSTITHADDFLATLVKYDYENANTLIAMYNEGRYGDNSPVRTNAGSRGGVSASAISSDILPYCVGYANNPVRVKIFKNKMNCDLQGWYTLFTFTAHTKKDKHHAPYPICETDFAYYESGTRSSGDKSISPVAQATPMFQAYTPHRMMLYPYYHGRVHGWELAYTLQTRSRYRPDLEPQQSGQGDPYTTDASKNSQYVSDATRDECKGVVSSSQIRVSRVSEHVVTSVEMVINNKVYTAVTTAEKTAIYPAHVRIALQESLRTVQPVAVLSFSCGDHCIVAMIDETIVTIGDGVVYRATI